MTANAPDRWEIDQDDFGRPLVRHRHPAESVPAYISSDAAGNETARCAECRETYRLRGKQTSPSGR